MILLEGIMCHTRMRVSHPRNSVLVGHPVGGKLAAMEVRMKPHSRHVAIAMVIVLILLLLGRI